MSTEFDRRRFVAVTMAGAGAAFVAASGGRVAHAGRSAGLVRPAAASWSPDDLVLIAANPSFRFASSTPNGDAAGEVSSIDADYYFSRYLVTNADWADFVADGGGTAPGYWADGAPPDGKGDHPVAFVPGVEAEAYCAWLTEQHAGWTLRLPTEAEWENAACGDIAAAYPWGDDLGAGYVDGTFSSKCNYNGVVAAWALAEHGDEQVAYSSRSSRAGETELLSEVLSVSADGGVQGWIDHATTTGFVYTELFEAITDAGGYTSPIGGYPPGATAAGLLDMAGNLWEWTSSIVTASNGAEQGQDVNAVRGGSWYATSRSCATTFRGEGREFSGGYNTIGIRVAGTPS